MGMKNFSHAREETLDFHDHGLSLQDQQIG
jgi:hypothetical protein